MLMYDLMLTVGLHSLISTKHSGALLEIALRIIIIHDENIRKSEKN